VIATTSFSQKVIPISNRAMKTRLFLSFCLFILLSGCKQPGSVDQTEVSIEVKEAITKKLEGIAMEFLKSWEPPFDPDGALALFTQGADFHLIIDGYVISNYEDWARNVPNFMSDDNYFFESYKHDIKNIETVVLSPKSGVVTIVYTWDTHPRSNYTYLQRGGKRLEDFTLPWFS